MFFKPKKNPEASASARLLKSLWEHAEDLRRKYRAEKLLLWTREGRKVWIRRNESYDRVFEAKQLYIIQKAKVALAQNEYHQAMRALKEEKRKFQKAQCKVFPRKKKAEVKPAEEKKPVETPINQPEEKTQVVPYVA